MYSQEKLRGLSLNFHIHMSVSDLYIFPGFVHIFSCSRIGRPIVGIVGIYKSLTDTEMWKLGHAIPFLGIVFLEFSVLFLGIAV
jgi:hypothetical protein